MKQMDTENNYAAGWRDLRRRRVLFAWASVITAAYFFIAALIFYKTNQAMESVVVAVFFGGLPFGISFHYLTLFRCLRCSKLFFVKYGFIDPFVRKCRHCELPMWAEKTGRPRKTGQVASLIISREERQEQAKQQGNRSHTLDKSRLLFGTGQRRASC
jgi:hypothetical protein